MKKLIVHIGYHKTGTSFLNRKFFPIHPDIFHLGKPYDDDDPIREFTERVIGVRRYDVERCKALYNEYIKPIRENKITSISDGRIVNHIANNNLRDIPERLLNITKDVSVIMVIRRQYDYLKSLYVQRVGAANEKKSFNEWFDSNWENGIRLNKQVDYLAKIQAYLDILGKENVGIFIYESFREDAGGFTHDLCNFIGLDCTSLKRELVNNEKINQRMTTLHQFISTHLVFNYIAIMVKKILSDRVRGSIRNLIFNNFNSYNPELSVDRIRLVQESAMVVNNRLISELNLDLYRYNYDI
jgi:hypothetical protein